MAARPSSLVARPADTPVLLVGPGAIGTFLGAQLVRAGYPVTVACRTDTTAKTLATQGLVARADDGERLTSRVTAVTKPKDVPKPARLVLLATKCADAPDALRTWLPAATPDALVVGLQNGLLGDTLAPLASGRYLDSVVHFPASLDGPGRSIQTGPGGLDLGILDSAQGPSATPEARDHAATVLGHAVTTTTTDNIRGAKWTKLIINSCITTLGVVTGVRLGDLLESKRARDAFLAIATEGHDVGKAEGVTFETVARFHPARFALPPDASPIRRAALNLLIGAMARKYKAHRSSSLQSLERGQKTEVDYLNGVIVATGAKHNIPTPVNAALLHAVHAIEDGRTSPNVANLDALPL